MTTTIQMDVKPHPVEIIPPDEALRGIHGVIVSRSFLEKYNLFFPNIKYSCEDTIFRVLLFGLSKNRKTYSDSFYKYIDNPDSCFMHNYG
jgi:hypothetical protein